MSKRSLTLFTLVLLLAVVLLVAAPFAIRHYASAWLLENGGEQVEFQDVDFNPFTARLVLKGLLVKVNRETTLAFDSASADLAWRPLFSKQISIESVALNGFDILIDDRPADKLLLGGIALPAGEPDDAPPQTDSRPWLAGIQTLALNDFGIRFKNTDLDIDLHFQALTLDNVSQWASESFTTLKTTGSLNDAPFEISGELAPLAQDPQYNLRVSINGLALEHFAMVAQPHTTGLAGNFSYQGDISFRQTASGFRLTQDGTTRLQALDVDVAQPAIQILNRDTAVTGNLDISSGEAGQALKLNYDVKLEGLNLVADDKTLELIHADTLSLSGLTMDGTDNIAISNIDILKFGFGRSADNKADDAFIDVERFQVADLAFADRLLSIDTVRYHNGHSNMKRDAGGNFRVVGILDSMNRLIEKQEAESEQAPPPAENIDTGETQEPLGIKVNRIEVSGDSKISFLDESVKPAFETVVKLDALLVENLDTRAPQQMSPFKLSGGIGKHSSFSLQGKAQPFLEPPGLDLKANISALDLPPLSPYTRQSLGLVLDSGTLDTDATALVNQSRMDGKISLKLHQLEFDNVESENSLQSRIPVPLNVALDTLRDKHNTISLEIPIKGDPANPDFSINDALSQALATGVQKGALTYLTLALQPYGTLITAAKYAGETISKVHLKPVEFDAGQATIDTADQDYLSKVAAVLTDRPQVTIKLCGVVVGADADYFQQQAAPKQPAADQRKEQKPVAVDETRLQALARDRAAAVKDHLIDIHKIPAARLVGCRPRLELDDTKALARTDLLI